MTTEREGVGEATQDMAGTEALIARLAAGLSPVRRLPSPWAQAGGWLGFAGVLIAGIAAWQGLREDFGARMGVPQELAQWVACLATGIAAAVAAAMLARPDRSDRWALLPLPFLAAWLATVGWGCLADVARLGPSALSPGVSWGCFGFITGLGVPLTAALLLLLRHAGPVRPMPVLLLAGLAAAALCSAGLSLFHHLDAALEVLIWHGAAIALVALLGRALGGWLLLPSR